MAAALHASLTDAAVVVEAHGDGRYPSETEAAAYFCALEAVQNARKHAGASQITVEVDAAPDALTAHGRPTTAEGSTWQRRPAVPAPRTGRVWPTCATGWTPREGTLDIA